MNEWKIFICFLSFIERRKMTKISCFICNILYSSTEVMRASNPSHSCREEASNTPATSTQEEKHPQSLPRGRKNERLYRMDLPRINWMSLQEEVQEPSIKRRLDVNQQHQCSAIPAGETRKFKVRTHTTVLRTSMQLHSHRKKLWLYWRRWQTHKRPRREWTGRRG